MTTTIASVNCYGGFLKTKPKILQTFFTYILEAQQFTLAKVTLNQVLSTQVNSSRLDKVQNVPVEKILSAEFFFFGIRQRCSVIILSKEPNLDLISAIQTMFLKRH